MFHIVGDIVALLDALDARQALIVGNDWEATIAWQAARLRPDRFRGVVALGVPMMPHSPKSPTSYFPESDDSLFYVRYFLSPGVAEAELDSDVNLTLRRILFGASADARAPDTGDEAPNPFGMVSRAHGLLGTLPDPDALPGWLQPEDLDAFVSSYRGSGFRGRLNYYRNLDRNWQLLAGFADVPVAVPATFLVGERDPGLAMPGMREIIAQMSGLVSALDVSRIVPNAGHWLQQEEPVEVNAEIVRLAQKVFP